MVSHREVLIQSGLIFDLDKIGTDSLHVDLEKEFNIYALSGFAEF